MTQFSCSFVTYADDNDNDGDDDAVGAGDAVCKCVSA